jgi:hypothetical protein
VLLVSTGHRGGNWTTLHPISKHNIKTTSYLFKSIINEKKIINNNKIDIDKIKR